MGLSIAGMVVSIVASASSFGSMMSAIWEEDVEAFWGSLGSMMAVGSIASLVSIVLTVFLYISLYDLYLSCNPENAVLYLVLSILITVSMPFFIFFSRNKDLGMPPRKSQPEAAPPQIPQPPTWQQPSSEPWEN